jgi:hypothetical protein
VVEVTKVETTIPTMIAHVLPTILGIRLHHKTALIPHFSAMKLNGIVTIKSEANNISPHDYSNNMQLAKHIPHTTLIVSMLPCNHASLR